MCFTLAMATRQMAFPESRASSITPSIGIWSGIHTGALDSRRRSMRWMRSSSPTLSVGLWESAFHFCSTVRIACVTLAFGCARHCRLCGCRRHRYWRVCNDFGRRTADLATPQPLIEPTQVLRISRFDRDLMTSEFVSLSNVEVGVAERIPDGAAVSFTFDNCEWLQSATSSATSTGASSTFTLIVACAAPTPTQPRLATMIR